MPAAVYWGRAPSKERSLIRLLLSEDWVIGSRVRRFFTVLFNGRNTTVQLGEPMSLRGLLEADADTAVTARRVSAAAAARSSRACAPRASGRTCRTGARSWPRCCAPARCAPRWRRRCASSSRAHAARGVAQARRYANEIAANYSHVFVTFMAHVLTRLWNRLYDGIEFQHVDTLQQVAEGNEIIYVPCHRSHMDYLLLSYAIYQRGYAVPHIAAG